MSEVASKVAVIVDFIESNTSSDDRDEVMQGVLDQLRKRGKVKCYECTTFELRTRFWSGDKNVDSDLREFNVLLSEGWNIVDAVPFQIQGQGQHVRVHYTLQRPRFR